MSTNQAQLPKEIETIGLPNRCRARVTASMAGVWLTVERAVTQTVVIQRDPTGFATSWGGWGGGEVLQQITSWVEIAKACAPAEPTLWAMLGILMPSVQDQTLGKVARALNRAWAAVVEIRRITVTAEVVREEEIPALPSPRLGLPLFVGNVGDNRV